MTTDEPVPPQVLMEHLRASHANVQDVIKFVDTKTGALTGLVTLVLTFPFLLVRYFIGDNFDSSKCTNPFPALPYLPILALGAMTLSVLGGVAGIWCSLKSLVARPPRRWIKSKVPQKEQFCILFPFYNPKQSTSAHEYFSKIVNGLTQKELLTEYQHQVEQLGCIVERKVRWHRRAALCFQVQLVLPLFVVIPINLTNYLWGHFLSVMEWLQTARKS